MVAGTVSGYRECWDFDDAETYDAFLDAAVACGLGDVVSRIRAGYEDETPRAGRRWIVEYPESVTWRDCTLARRTIEARKVETLIELPTFAILAPSHGRTHPSGRPYVRLSGGFDTIARYTQEERDALIALARSFDEMPRRQHAPAQSATTTSETGLRPGDDFNRRTSWAELLEPHGWAHVYTRGDVWYWRRPEKPYGVSATSNFGWLRLVLRVFELDRVRAREELFKIRGLRVARARPRFSKGGPGARQKGIRRPGRDCLHTVGARRAQHRADAGRG